MRKYLLTFLIFVFAVGCFAQTLSIDWGAFSEQATESYVHKVLGADANGVYVVRSENVYGCVNTKVYLDYYDNTDFSLSSSSEILMPSVSGSETAYEDMFFIDGKFILFTKAIDNHRKQQIAYVQYMTKEGTLKNKPKEIGALPIQNGKLAFNYLLSPDGKRIMFFYYPFFTEYSGQEIPVIVFESSLNEVFSKKLVLPLKGRTFEVEKWAIGNSGNIYALAKMEMQNEKKSASSAGMEYAIVSYNKDRNDFHVQNIELKKYTAASVTFGMTATEELVVGGTYTSKAMRNGELQGVFYKVYDPKIQKITSGTVDAKNTYLAFDRNDLPTFNQKRLGPMATMYNYVMKDAFVLDNGNFVFLGEHQYTESQEIKDPATKTSTFINYYNHNDIIAFGVEGNTVKWYHRLYKNQHGVDDNGYYSSYVAVATRNKVKIFYNDHPGNLKVDTPDKSKQIKNNVKTNAKGLSIVHTIFNDGSLDKSVMFNNDDEKTVFIPKSFGYIGDDRYIVSGQKGKYVKFGSFFFE